MKYDIMKYINTHT